MKELLDAIVNSSATQQISLLLKALEYGELGVDFLIECLDNPELEIRAKAYQLLQNVDLEKAKNAIARGLLFNPGDKIYDVIENYIDYSDGFGRCYLLYSSKKIDAIKNLITYDDYRNENYTIVSFGREVYIRTYSFNRYYLNYNQAQLTAKLLQKQKISTFSIAQFVLKNKRPRIEQWCNQYKLLDKVIKFQEIKANKSSNNVVDEFDNIDCSIVENYLKNKNNLKLLNQLWQDFVGKFAGVYEICFDKKTYLTINPYYSSIIKQERQSIYHDYQGSLFSEDAEINLLLTVLNSSELEMRSIAYQLLRGIESEKAQEAIYQGIKLNPGDKIYSIYEALIWFTDESYLLFDGVDYLQEIREQVYGKSQDDDDEYWNRDKLIYCYVDRNKAEQKAETIHRNSISKYSISDICGFFWERRNLDFDLKKWCLENNLLSRACHQLKKRAFF